MAKKSNSRKTVAALKHEQVIPKNVPRAEHQSVLQKQERNLVRFAFERRNRDLDPQSAWLVCRAVSIQIQPPNPSDGALDEVDPCAGELR